jgi:uncharacterized protein
MTATPLPAAARDGAAAHARDQARGRIEAVDALRGLALMGIVQINIQSFTWGAGEPLGYLAAPPGNGESLLYFLQAALIEGKFYPIFAFLFGVGIALQTRKLRRLHGPDAAAAAAAYRRRLLILFAVGIAHGLLFFSGDVISTYAACALLFVTIAPARPRDLLYFNGATWVVAALGLLLPMAIAAVLGSDESPEQIPAAVAAAHEVYCKAGFIGQLGQRAIDEVWQQLGDIPTFWPQVLALFGLGTIAGRLGWLQNPARHPRLWRRAWRLGLWIGLPLSIAGAALSVMRARTLPGADAGWESVLLGLGSLLSAAYVAAAVHVFQQPWGRRLRHWLAASGRLSLSNYVGQSVLMAALLSGWGLGLGSQASRAQLALMGGAIFLAQVLVSHAIVQRYRQGPLEALWRRATYGRHDGSASVRIGLPPKPPPPPPSR